MYDIWEILEPTTDFLVPSFPFYFHAYKDLNCLIFYFLNHKCLQLTFLTYIQTPIFTKNMESIILEVQVNHHY